MSRERSHEHLEAGKISAHSTMVHNPQEPELPQRHRPDLANSLNLIAGQELMFPPQDGARGERGTATLMSQFVSHRAQQLRHVKGFLKGLPCPEECRDIQGVLFPSCA
jgi:hypothetical protein